MESEIEPIYHLSVDEIAGLDVAFHDIYNGEVYSTSSANELLNKWLKK